MIYFDNAATAMARPQEVVDAVVRALTTFGNVGRGAHDAAISADMAVFDARRKVAELLGAPSPSRVAFGYNVTEALNVAIAGLLRDGDRALTTAASHNSVLRPLFRARDERGCAVDVAPIRPDASLDFDAYGELLRTGRPRLVVATHASNLTGDVYDVARMANMAHEVGALFVLDAAQTAGALPVDMAALGVDVLCFTGHKSLLGPQGTGGLCVAEGVEVRPLLEGGTGVHSYDERQPLAMPESLEAGTLNAHGLAGLAAGIDYLQRVGVEHVAARVAELTERFETGVANLPGVRVYGGHGGVARTGVVALNVGEVDSGRITSLLAEHYGICTRSGAHCAPLMHRALGTVSQGAVRFSFSHLNTEDEIDAGIAAMTEITGELAG
ncbi:MAG: aminotransferase class V-fold PLP-dependent enzyme [Coriobacteriia bacterium]|nr:aminotransferase class V-fold PLP-dependent enzyme [Coriobacteriia bacterium]MBS5477197.1 aminotransferase class V-fold PLP-dependent enzyme [Coriobacteriia bacterium]